mgnify:FL=1
MEEEKQCRSPNPLPPPRLTIEINQDQAYALNSIFEHGERKLYFTAVIDATIDIHRRFGKEALYLMMSGQVNLMEILTRGKANANNSASQKSVATDLG